MEAMNPVEKLEGAIAKLELLKGAKTPAPWWRGMNDGFSFTIEGPESDSHPVAQRLIGPDAEMMVTLHRTIDAQLRILTLGLRDYEHHGDMRMSLPLDHSIAALALADAILGDPS